MTSEFTITVHAPVFLNRERVVLSNEGLAVNVCTNATRIRKVMAELKKTNLMKTKEGVDGGYLFHRGNRDVDLPMVAEVLDTPLMAASWKNGNPCMVCLISSGMAGIADELYEELNQCYRAYLGKAIIADLDSKIFTSTPKTVAVT